MLLSWTRATSGLSASARKMRVRTCCCEKVVQKVVKLIFFVLYNPDKNISVHRYRVGFGTNYEHLRNCEKANLGTSLA